MATIYLIRHGQASFGKEDYDQLSELGQTQANHLGTMLSQRLPPPNGTCSGTMLRHHQTHQGVTQAWTSSKAEHVDDAAWNEYDHQEILAKYDERLATAKSTKAYLQSLENPKQAFAQCFTNATAKWQSGDHDDLYSESWQTFKQRVLGGLQKLSDSLEDKQTVMVFTSGGPISVITQALMGLPDEKLVNINWTLANCGVTKLVKTKSSLFLATLNDHSHFEGQHQHLITYK